MPEHRKRVKRILLALVGVLVVFSALMIFAAWYASSIAPRLMQQNYQSIQYAYQMQNAFVSIYVAESGGKQLDPIEVQKFDQNLKNAKANVTEVGEAQILDELDVQWSNFKKKNMTPVVEEFQAMLAAINRLTIVNERGMYSLSDRASQLGLTIVSIGLLALVLITIYALLIADSLIQRIE